MTMMQAICTGSVLAAAALLLTSGTRHARDDKRLLAVLLTHDVLPYRFSRVLSKVQGPAELLVSGLIVLASVVLYLGWTSLAFQVASALAASGFALMTAYVGLLVLLGKDVPCGCFDDDRRVSVWTMISSAVLTVGAAGSAASTGSALASQVPLTAITAAAVVVWIRWPGRATDVNPN